MDNQHKKISGYRDLSQQEIDTINEIKRIERDALKLLYDMEQHMVPDRRWLAIGCTDLQKGFMAAVRAIAKPE